MAQDQGEPHLGHVIYAPSIIFGAGTDQQQYIQDIAVIEIDTSKINPYYHFPGNRSSIFSFPKNRILNLQGTIPIEEKRTPRRMWDQDEWCIAVLKWGRTTDLTLGKGTKFVSYTRDADFLNMHGMSMEYAVIPLDTKSGPLSGGGDSGSVVVDGFGRIAGILTASSGSTDSTDVTYVTPIDFIMEVIHSHPPLAEAIVAPARPPPSTEAIVAPPSPLKSFICDFLCAHILTSWLFAFLSHVRRFIYWSLVSVFYACLLSGWLLMEAVLWLVKLLFRFN
jgi:hypothetical protein